jgi:hypothetical protein
MFNKQKLAISKKDIEEKLFKTDAATGCSVKRGYN